MLKKIQCYNVCKDHLSEFFSDSDNVDSREVTTLKEEIRVLKNEREIDRKTIENLNEKLDINYKEEASKPIPIQPHSKDRWIPNSIWKSMKHAHNR